MKKEKQVRSYKRRTKSGKTVTVKAHTAKYEAADEKAKEVSKKPGAGKELEERKKKPVQLEIPFGKEEEKKVLDEVKGAEVSKMTGASLTRDAKLPEGITIKGSWRKISDAGTKGIGHSSWSSKADVFEATLSDGRKVTLHRTYGPAGETKVSYSSGESTKKPAEKKTTKKVRPVGSGTNGPTPKRKSEAKVTKTTASKPATSEPAFTAAEFKEWYRGTGSATDKKVAKALRAQLGRSGYRKFEDEAIDNYTSRGHLSMFKRVSGGSSTSAKPKSSLGTKKETSSDLRARADKMDADTKRSAIVKKLGSNKFRTIKDININVVKPNTRSAQLKGTLYVSSDRTKAYYEGSDGKLKKATKSILDRYVNKESKKRSVGTGTNGPEPKKTAISEQSLNSKGFKTFKMPQVGTLYLGKKGKGAYIKFKGKRNIQRADIDDYGDFITGHNGLTKAQKKQLSSLGYTEHEEY